MTVSDFAELAFLNDAFNSGSGLAIAADPHVALFTADPGETGASNEVTGGSYARVQAAFDNAAAGTLANSGNIDFTLMPTTTVMAFGIFDASTAGNCLWTGWLSTVSGLALVRSGDLAGNDIQSVAHGLVLDDRVVFETVEGLTIPAGITAGTVYFVLSAGLTTDAFNISTTSGGGEVDITAAGSAIWRKVTPKAVNSGDTFRIATGDLDIFLD